MSRSTEGFAKFALGVLVGAGLGVLFAPKSGAETREDLKASMEDLMNKVKNIDPEEVKIAMEEKIADIKAELKSLDKEKVLEIAKKKGNEIKEKCDDLVEYAKEKGSPIVEKTAKDMKSKAATVVRGVLEKLEDEEK